jgi:glycosyltransferase involved in cell wall biosynthesis
MNTARPLTDPLPSGEDRRSAPEAETAPIGLSLVVPCFDEEPHLEESVRAIERVLVRAPFRSEIIFVDDCSRDGTRSVIERLVAAESAIPRRYIPHPINRGRGAAVRTGFEAASGTVVGFIDIDLELPAHNIIHLVDQIELGADVATAHRYYRTTLGTFHRMVLSKGYSFLVRLLLAVELQDTETGCKFFRRERVLPLLPMVRDTRWFWDTEIMVASALAGLEVREVPCVFIKRPDKKSTVRLFRDSIIQFRRLLELRRALRDR